MLLKSLAPTPPRTCAGAGLDPGCCEGNCTVALDDSEDDFCYCDNTCKEQGDCCSDVNQTRQCNQCTMTIGKKVGPRTS